MLNRIYFINEVSLKKYEFELNRRFIESSENLAGLKYCERSIIDNYIYLL
jgi:hypothetical protein